MQQILLILNLQWTLFKNSLRFRANQWELIARIIFAAAVFLFDAGIAIGLAAVIVFFYSNKYIVHILTLVFFGIFLYWQMLPLLTASFGGGLNVTRFRLYPISTRKLFILDLFSGIIDPAAISVYLPLMGIFFGVVLASAHSAFLAAALIFLFVVFNVALTRYMQQLIERFFSSRRRKEIFLLFLSLIMIIVSIAPQFLLRREMKNESQRHDRLEVNVDSSLEKFKAAMERLRYLGWTPPGLAARGIAGTESPTEQTGVLLGAIAFAAVALALAYRRLHYDFYGQASGWNKVSGTLKVAAMPPVPNLNSYISQQLAARSVADKEAVKQEWLLKWFRNPLATVFEKEIKYFYRSTRMLLLFISSVLFGLFITFPWSRSTSGTTPTISSQFLLAGACFYSLLIVSPIFTNSFCFDSHGAKLFFLTPVRGRDVLVAKNLAASIVVILQVFFIATSFHFLFYPLTLRIALNTIFVVAIAFFSILSMGNYLSVLYPKTIDFSKLGGASYSKIAMVLTVVMQFAVLIVVAISPLLGWLMKSTWIVYFTFSFELVVTVMIYFFLLNRVGKLFEERAEKFFQAIL